MTDVTIDASTPVGERRIADTATLFRQRPRLYDANPGAGSVLIKTSVDGGLTYQTKFVLEADGDYALAGDMQTYQRLIEIECTGDATFTWVNAPVLYGD